MRLANLVIFFASLLDFQSAADADFITPNVVSKDLLVLLQIPNQLFYSTDVSGFSTSQKIFDLDVMMQPLICRKDSQPRELIRTVFVSHEVKNLVLHTMLYHNIKIGNLFQG